MLALTQEPRNAELEELFEDPEFRMRYFYGELDEAIRVAEAAGVRLIEVTRAY